MYSNAKNAVLQKCSFLYGFFNRINTVQRILFTLESCNWTLLMKNLKLSIPLKMILEHLGLIHCSLRQVYVSKIKTRLPILWVEILLPVFSLLFGFVLLLGLNTHTYIYIYLEREKKYLPLWPIFDKKYSAMLNFFGITFFR